MLEQNSHHGIQSSENSSDRQGGGNELPRVTAANEVERMSQPSGDGLGECQSFRKSLEYLGVGHRCWEQAYADKELYRNYFFR
jgi:hypothetical protein